MGKGLLIVLVAMAVRGAVAAGPDVAPSSEISRAVLGDAPQSFQEVMRGPIRFSTRRYSGSTASNSAYERIESALSDLAKSQGLTIAPADTQPAVTVEVDSSFYVYTNRFNAWQVRLPEYTEAQMAGQAGKTVASQPPQSVDALRIAAGVIGIIQGWISPSFGSYMISGGAAPTLFGSGDAPRRLFVAGRERYERGEQEVNTKVRVMRDGTLVGSFSVRCWTLGDEAPFDIDRLVVNNWLGVLDVLQGSPVRSTTVERSDRAGG